ncbi:MAG: hypothetical protein ACKVS6_13080 [Planctomycetota bacterium]
MAVLVLALITAGWRAEAHRTAGENEGLERQIAQLARARDDAREDVDFLRQPFAVRLRSAHLSKTDVKKTDTKKNADAKPAVTVKSAKDQPVKSEQKGTSAAKPKTTNSAKARVQP